MLTSDIEGGIKKFREVRTLKSIFHRQRVHSPTNYIPPKSLKTSSFTRAFRNTLTKGSIYILEKFFDVLLCRSGMRAVPNNMGSLIQQG